MVSEKELILEGLQAEISGHMLELSRGSDVEIANALVSHLSRLGRRVVFSHGAFHVYESSGCWERIEAAEIRGLIHALDGKELDPGGNGKPRTLNLAEHRVKGIYGCMADNLETARPEFFSEKRIGLGFANGFAAVTGDGIKLEEHDPDNRIRHRVEFDFDAEANPKKFVEFLFSLFVEGKDAAAVISFIQEFVGACLCGVAVDFETCLLLTGTGANGKSVFQEAVRALFPDDMQNAVSPMAWGKEGNLATLDGIAANICDELPANKLLEADIFKQVISGSTVQARTLYKTPFTFAPRAGHIFAANSLPPTRDHSEGFWRRFSVVPFIRNFEKSPDRRNKRELIEELVSEAPQITIWALRGAQRLLLKNEYTIPKCVEEAKEEWRIEADSVYGWLDDTDWKPAPAEEAYCKSKDVLYSDYTEWCYKNGQRPVSHVAFGKRIKKKHFVRGYNTCGVRGTSYFATQRLVN